MAQRLPKTHSNLPQISATCPMDFFAVCVDNRVACSEQQVANDLQTPKFESSSTNPAAMIRRSKSLAKSTASSSSIKLASPDA
jgi:uncharacterized tellurite resistance protein B-like protein